MRDLYQVSVLLLMAVYTSHTRQALLLLTASLCAPLSAQTHTTMDLPNSRVFRDEMLGWANKPEEPHRLTTQVIQTKAASQTLPRLSSYFGHRRDPLGGPARQHAGIDIPASHGTPVLASGHGWVRFAGWAGGYGNMVEIDHGGGISTRYAHLSRIMVQTRAAVSTGETIALIGSTGRSTGPHLHFEVRQNGRPTDPLNYLGYSAPAVISRSLWAADRKPHISHFAHSRAQGTAAHQHRENP